MKKEQRPAKTKALISHHEPVGHPRPFGTRNDLCRLIEFSLRDFKVVDAIRLFPMFNPDAIKTVFAIRRSMRERLLENRVRDQSELKQCRILEQLQKMAEIATDPSNR